MLVKEEKSSSTHFGISWVPEFFTMVTLVGLKWDKRGFKTNAVAIILLLHTYIMHQFKLLLLAAASEMGT